MKTDIRGCSTTGKGQEQYESFYSNVLRKKLIQYDYRDVNGELFSCVAPTIEIARQKRDGYFATL